MARQCLAAFLVLITAWPTSAQTLRASIESAVAQSAAQQRSAAAPGAIPPKFLWTGISLLGAGGGFLIGGALQDPVAEPCLMGNEVVECADYRGLLLKTGGVLAGAGAALLVLGFVKRHSPQVTFRPGGFAVQQSVPLGAGGSRSSRRP